MSKSKLIGRLTELAKALGITPTPLAWASKTREELEEAIKAAEREIKARANANANSAAARNDAEWFDAGGTRN